MLRLRQVDKFLARPHRVLGDGELLVQRQQREVGGGDAGDQPGHHILLGICGREQPRTRGLGSAPVLAPEIEFIGEAPIRRKHVADRRHAGDALVHRSARALRVGRNRNLRQLLQTRRAENGARLLDACRGNAHVEVVVECLADQRLQGWVLVNLPPSLIGEGLGRGGRLEAEGSRDLRLGPVVIGSERACHHQQGGDGGNDAAQVAPHDCTGDVARLPSRRSCRLCTNT